jgi:hypothetical protein
MDGQQTHFGVSISGRRATPVAALANIGTNPTSHALCKKILRASVGTSLTEFFGGEHG